MYRSQKDDLKWSRNGLVETVIKEEAIPLIRSTVEDMGFNDLNIIPLGGDKVFIHSLSEADVMKIVGDAKQFFDHIFSNIVRWDKKVMPFQGGA